jgi:hypothetical protein
MSAALRETSALFDGTLGAVASAHTKIDSVSNHAGRVQNDFCNTIGPEPTCRDVRLESVI